MESGVKLFVLHHFEYFLRSNTSDNIGYVSAHSVYSQCFNYEDLVNTEPLIATTCIIFFRYSFSPAAWILALLSIFRMNLPTSPFML